jgi:Fe-S-cluster containining protein
MAACECDGCGACCRTFPVFASRADGEREPRVRDEAPRVPPWLEEPGRAYRLFPLPFLEACCFLDAANRCTIYGTRPDVCRTFAAGNDQCQEARARSGLPPLGPAA